jgi:hypothetical protein
VKHLDSPVSQQQGNDFPSHETRGASHYNHTTLIRCHIRPQFHFLTPSLTERIKFASLVFDAVVQILPGIHVIKASAIADGPDRGFHMGNHNAPRVENDQLTTRTMWRRISL